MDPTVVQAQAELFDACESGDCQKVLSLMQLEINVNTIREDGKTPLMVAAKHGFSDIVQCLLLYEADALIRDKDRVIAVEMVKNSPETLKCLTEETMFVAAAKGKLEVLQKMIDLNIDPNITENDEYEYTPLLWACFNGCPEVVELLLEKGADINTISNNNWNGLLLACRYGYYEVAKTLIESGISVNHHTDDGWTALMFLASDGNAELTELLLLEGANPFIPNKEGFTPLILAAQNEHYEVVKILVELCDMDVNEQRSTNPEDCPAIMFATNAGNIDIVKYLVRNGADIHEPKIEHYWTAAFIAILNNHFKVLQSILEINNFDPTIRDKEGNTLDEFEYLQMSIERQAGDVE